MTDFKLKYLKYKNKYISLKKSQQTSGSGYLSEDDEDLKKAIRASEESYEEEYTTIPEVLHNFSEHKVTPLECGGGGNCFFHAVSYLMGGDSGDYVILRDQLADYFKPLETKDGIEQIFWDNQKLHEDIRNEGVYIEDEIQITAMSTIIKRPIRIFDSRGTIRIITGVDTSGEPINLYHIVPRHYQALVPVQAGGHQIYEVKQTANNPNILKLYSKYNM